jgi:hypothetical protein
MMHARQTIDGDPTEVLQLTALQRIDSAHLRGSTSSSFDRLAEIVNSRREITTGGGPINDTKRGLLED